MIKPRRIIHNGFATIVFWNDGTKTVVKCAEDDEPDAYMAFCAAYCKKVFGSNSHLKRAIKDAEKAGPEKKALKKEMPIFKKGEPIKRTTVPIFQDILSSFRLDTRINDASTSWWENNL